MKVPQTRRLTAHEIENLTREDMLALIGPSLLEPNKLSDAQLREVVSTYYVIAK